MQRVRAPDVPCFHGRRRSVSKAPTAPERCGELSCDAKEHLLRVDPDTGALTRYGQFARTTFCDASVTVAGGDVFVLYGQKLYVYS